MPCCVKRSQIRILLVPILFLLFLFYVLHIKQRRLTLPYKQIAYENESQDIKTGKIELIEELGPQQQYQHPNEDDIKANNKYEENMSIDAVAKEVGEGVNEIVVGENEVGGKMEENEKKGLKIDEGLLMDEESNAKEILNIEEKETEIIEESKEVNPGEKEVKETLPMKIHEVSMEEPYRSRLINISQRCKALNHSIRPLSKSSLKYHDDIKVVMCEVPKVASTTWQVLLLRLGGFEGETQFRKFGYKEIYLKTFRNLANETMAISKMQSYLSFFLTRHPFERLVSAYSDKLTNRSKATWYRETMGRKIAKKEAERYLAEIKSTLTVNELEKGDIQNLTSFLAHSDQEKLEILSFCEMMKTGEVSFLHFVKHVIDEYQNGMKEDMDGHWIPQTDLCMPCAYQYSYVIRFDNVVPESQKLLDYLQTKTNFTQKKLNFPKDRPSVVKDEATQKAFMNIDRVYVDALRKLYAEDFYLLDHNPYLYNGREE